MRLLDLGCHRRSLRYVLIAVASIFGMVGGGGLAVAPAIALSSAAHPQSFASCSSQQQVSSCDSDTDGIPDTVERIVCGTATCATGREDTDEDGVPDWVEVMACGTVSCASPTKDSVGDGIPDYARMIVCGSSTCWSGNSNVNANGVPKWASVVICGTTGCATGSEDYNGNGISDAVELAACVHPRNVLASTGSQVAIGLIAALAAGLIVTGVVLARKRRLFQAALGSDLIAACAGPAL